MEIKQPKEFFKEKYFNDPETYREIVKEINHRYYMTHKEAHKKSQKAYSEKKPAKRLFFSCRGFAKRNGVEFNIEQSDIIVPEFCPIMGIKLDFRMGMGRLNAGPSIDRIDSSKGYVKGNIRVISLLANRMKSNANEEELKMFAEGILKLLAAKSVIGV